MTDHLQSHSITIHEINHKIDDILKNAHQVTSLVTNSAKNLATITNELTNQVSPIGEPLYPDSVYNKINNIYNSTLSTTEYISNIYDLALYNTALTCFNTALGYDPSNNKAILYDCAGLLVDSSNTLSISNSVYKDLTTIMLNNINQTTSPSIIKLASGNNSDVNTLLQAFNSNYNGRSKPAYGPTLLKITDIPNNTFVPTQTNKIGDITYGQIIGLPDYSMPNFFFGTVGEYSLSTSYTSPSIMTNIARFDAGQLAFGTYILEGCVAFKYWLMDSTATNDFINNPWFYYNYYTISITNDSQKVNPNCCSRNLKGFGIGTGGQECIYVYITTLVTIKDKTTPYYLYFDISVTPLKFNGRTTGSNNVTNDPYWRGNLSPFITSNGTYFKATRIA